MIRLIALVKPLTGFMLLAILLGALGNFCSILIPVLGGFAFSRIAGLPAPLELNVILALAPVAALLRGGFRYGEQLCNHDIAFKLLALIRERVFAALRRLCPAKLEGRERGNLIALLTGDIELLEVFYAHTISPAAIAIITSLVMTLMIGAYHPVLGGAAALGYLVVGAGLPALGGWLARDRGAAAREGAGELASYYLDSLRGLDDIAQLGRGDSRLAELERRTDELEAIQGGLREREGLIGGLAGLGVTLCALGVLGLAFTLWRSGAGGGFETVLIPTIAALSSFGPVIALANLSTGLQATLAAGQRVIDLLDETPEVEEIQGGATPEFTGAYSRGLDFSYGGGEVLRGVTLDIPQGKITGVVGRSGAGKSTFLRLLMRFWAPPRGSVFVSGVDIETIDTNWLRTLEGFVTQETDLFHDSVEANIKLGKPEASREEVVAAAKRASAHDFIAALPQGYDTPVGELGGTLSGGERQRIGLARAFLRGAPLLLLDEPTSNLDSLNEGIILKSLREMAGERTAVLVSHRLSTMAVADEVYSLESRNVKT
jgi:thiol reductant ABC exporter CydC subunit